LAIAGDAGCLNEDALACVQRLQEELVQAQPETSQPHASIDVDLYAARLRTLLLSGYDKPVVHGWARALIGLQQGDGSWAGRGDDDPYDRYRATNAATWALAEWLWFLALHHGQAAPVGALRVQAPAPIGGPAFWGCSLPPAVVRESRS
jgi:hypothetical protein